MNVAFYMNCVSTHQLPLAKEVAALVGVDNFIYVYEGDSGQSYQQASVEGLKFKVQSLKDGAEILETADLMYTGLRDLGLFERRAKKGFKTYYTSERWFKPIPLSGVKLEKLVGVGVWNLPGILRMLIPSYRKMVKRFVSWANSDPNARVLAIGPWAKKDFLRMGVKPEKIVDWGYFVAPSDRTNVSDTLVRSDRNPNAELKVLWAGRVIPLKHVNDIEYAVALANKKLQKEFAHLHSTLKTPTSTLPISFTKLTGVTPQEVRMAMRAHDTFVFASNGFEGWGAVVSEALEEGMNAIGTFECGAPPTLLPRERLFHCGDVKALAGLLEKECRGELPRCTIGEWTAKAAAKRLLDLV